MTDKRELEKLARRVDAKVIWDRDGRISAVEWNGTTYGNGGMLSLLCFAERARPAAAQLGVAA